MTKNKDDLIKIDGMKQASELLSGVDESTRRRILSEISAQNPALAEQLKKQMVSIETVLMLPSPDLLKLIDQLSDTLIALALRGITPELVEQFFDKISRRRGDEIKSELASMGPRRLGEIKVAREKMIEIAQTLFDKGEISSKLTKA